MSVFISYSHSDKVFVDQLAAELIKRRTHVWIDRYELRAGDSLITKIQDAIGSSGAMVVVLSKASVESEWCKKELASGLVRELEEKRVVVIPLLLEDCIIPLFLRDKYYADFRLHFEKGVRDVLEAIAGATSDLQGRVHTPDYHTDWSIDWSEATGLLVLRVSVIEHHNSAPFSVLTVIDVRCNSRATERYRRVAQEGYDWFGRGVIVEALAEIGAKNDLFLRLDDQFEQEATFTIDEKSGGKYDVIVKSRRLGEDTGKDILVNIGGQFQTLRDAVLANRRQLSPQEHRKLLELLMKRDS